MKQLFEALLKIGQRIFLVYSLLINISWAQSSKGTIASMDNILNEAGSLKSFLSSPVLRERYFKELTLYMEEESNFRGSYNEILIQLEAVSEKYPEIIPRIWDELPIQILNLKPNGPHSIQSKLRIRSLPRLFHSLFKGISAHEPTGGYNPMYFGEGPDMRPKISSLTPLRWASPLIEGSLFYHVEEAETPGQVSHFESYKGFIQITPGEIKGEVYGALEISSMELIFTDESESLEGKISTINRSIQEIYHRIPKSWKGLIVSNSRLNEQHEEMNSLTEFRLRNEHYIFGESLKSPGEYFKINDSLVSKLAEFKYAVNTKVGGMYVWANQLIIEATVSQETIDGVERFSPYLKDLTLLNPELPILKKSYSLSEILELLKKESQSGREEGVLKKLLPKMNEVSLRDRELAIVEFKNKKLSPQTLLTIYSAKGINDLNSEEVKRLLSLEGEYQQRYYNFALPDAAKILATKRVTPLAELSIYLTEIYQDVYNFKLPVQNWLKKLEKVSNYKGLLLFQGLNQSFEVSLAAARALQLMNPVQAPPLADIFVANALEKGIEDFNGEQFLIVNLTYLEKLLADYIKSSKSNSHQLLVTNIIKYGLSNMSLSDRIAMASIDFLSQKDLKLDQEQKDLLLNIRHLVSRSDSHPSFKKVRIEKINELLSLHSHDLIESQTCNQIVSKILHFQRK